ncbi:Putative uncharacterized protein [Taphrina deformans PYCC 5710]|uniref:C2H2-type domain-containing protein n=1 Tax=Taphrina deformans (strain PYCC 5710 / ATCC 11124 / CBS 356.35 / IMI 108563 / JCM 9778 / NBRC 8474) TaxID=1097556 RepID=R4XEF5_TAPDE|nr:Putative uncharacterized protein [Taphrina deformans PYCC 5710]|eukprot:CCG81752.1 Putative uncharacterized protein [Taphrina deformans PYCC 5710]
MAKRRRQEDVPPDNEVDHAITARARSASPSEKLSRVSPDEAAIARDHNGAELTCTLPPLCNLKPRTFYDVGSFESHYQKYHCNICNECLARFPTNIFLDLHLEECHDPIWSARLARGEKMFRCFVKHCSVRFGSATSRRRHLETVHQYPSEFRFNIVTKGLNKNAKSLLYDQKVRTAIRKNVQAPDRQMTGLTQEAVLTTEMISSGPGPESYRPPMTRAQRRAAARAQEDIRALDKKEAQPEDHDDAVIDKYGDYSSPQVKKMQDARELHKQSVHDLFKALEDPGLLEPKEQHEDDAQMDDLSSVLNRAQIVPAQIRFGNKHAR